MASVHSIFETQDNLQVAVRGDSTGATPVVIGFVQFDYDDSSPTVGWTIPAGMRILITGIYVDVTVGFTSGGTGGFIIGDPDDTNGLWDSDTSGQIATPGLYGMTAPQADDIGTAIDTDKQYEIDATGGAIDISITKDGTALTAGSCKIWLTGIMLET